MFLFCRLFFDLFDLTRHFWLRTLSQYFIFSLTFCQFPKFFLGLLYSVLLFLILNVLSYINLMILLFILPLLFPLLSSRTPRRHRYFDLIPLNLSRLSSLMRFLLFLFLYHLLFRSSWRLLFSVALLFLFEMPLDCLLSLPFSLFSCFLSLLFFSELRLHWFFWS